MISGRFYAHTDPDNTASQSFLRSAGLSWSGLKTIRLPNRVESWSVDSFSRLVTDSTRIRHKIHVP